MQLVTTTGFKGMVNAAFLQDVKDSNSQLWDLMDDLRTMPVSGLSTCDELDAAEVPRRSDLANLYVLKLSELKECLSLEFTLEETYGFIGGIAGPNEMSACDAQAARSQHRELYLRLHEICERADESQYRGTISRDLESFVEDFEAFDSELQCHEDLEAELIRSHLGARP